MSCKKSGLSRIRWLTYACEYLEQSSTLRLAPDLTRPTQFLQVHRVPLRTYFFPEFGHLPALIPSVTCSEGYRTRQENGPIM